MARQFDHVFGKGDGIPYAAAIKQVRAKPLVVMREIMNLVGQDPRRFHVGVVGARSGFLLPGGVIITLELAVGMAGHVPHVGNAWGGLAAAGGRVERILIVFVVPKMDAGVMNRVQGFDREHLAD